MNSKVKAIFFDVGNTLLFPNRERIHAPLTKRGILPDADLLRDLECRTKNQFDGMMTTNGKARIVWASAMPYQAPISLSLAKRP